MNLVRRKERQTLKVEESKERHGLRSNALSELRPTPRRRKPERTREFFCEVRHQGERAAAWPSNPEFAGTYGHRGVVLYSTDFGPERAKKKSRAKRRRFPDLAFNADGSKGKSCEILYLRRVLKVQDQLSASLREISSFNVRLKPLFSTVYSGEGLDLGRRPKCLKPDLWSPGSPLGGPATGIPETHIPRSRRSATTWGLFHVGSVMGDLYLTCSVVSIGGMDSAKHKDKFYVLFIPNYTCPPLLSHCAISANFNEVHFGTGMNNSPNVNGSALLELPQGRFTSANAKATRNL
ncbi:hypothetical protein B0H16DRAFT_1757463 [Mycena metata]|uniref:Uncharacterized protein n=1 Tax=Mycena metata TaxID=1033252 RepID=A0AAD7DEU2_9AGAR|nr:hypothetical protein B0H16DRAFT_1757463 [Mycena metata]